MNQAFNTLFNFNKGTVILDADNLAGNLGTDRIVVRSIGPGILFELFDTQGNPLTLSVVFDDFYINGLADSNPFARMVDPAPGDIGNVEKPVKAAEIDEGTVIGNVFNHTCDGSAFLEFFEKLFFHALANLFEDDPAGNYNIIAFLVMLKNPEFETLADKFIEVAYRFKINLGARQKCGHADID